MTIQDVLRDAQILSLEARRELIKQLVDTLTTEEVKPASPERSLRELRGLGKEIWDGIDAQEYITQQRDEWD